MQDKIHSVEIEKPTGIDVQQEVTDKQLRMISTIHGGMAHRGFTAFAHKQ